MHLRLTNWAYKLSSYIDMHNKFKFFRNFLHNNSYPLAFFDSILYKLSNNISCPKAHYCTVGKDLRNYNLSRSGSFKLFFS